MPPKPKLDVHNFPRPPLLEKTPRHLQVKWRGQTVADTKDAYWVLETTHPPTYYINREAFTLPLRPSPHTSFCEWKGRATYWNLQFPDDGKELIKNRAWSYESPAKGFEAIKGYISLYAEPWDCYVDGEKVEPQPGDFYGGWVTSDIEGRVKSPRKSDTDSEASAFRGAQGHGVGEHYDNQDGSGINAADWVIKAEFGFFVCDLMPSSN